jgi:hypothetical protein
MNILITILLGLTGIIALLLIIALFSKKGYTIERETLIKRNRADVFNYIKFLKNQDFYSKWVMTDPNMKKTFTGTDGTKGFVYAWDSNDKNAGKGEQEIKQIVDGEKTDVEIRFERPFKGVSQAHMTTVDSGGNQTKIRWTFISEMKYPMNIMLVFVNFDKLLGRDMEISLSTLKGILEK